MDVVSITRRCSGNEPEPRVDGALVALSWYMTGVAAKKLTEKYDLKVTSVQLHWEKT